MSVSSTTALTGRVRLTALGASLALGLVVAGCSDDTTAATEAPAGVAAAAATPTPPAHTAEHEPESEPLAGEELDRAFLAAMVGHHQAAVEMAEVELADGDNTDVKALAQQIIDSQEEEIATMIRIAESEYSFTPDMSHSGPMGVLMGVPISMNMSTMAQEVAAASNVDRMFLTMMIPHHASAILMADELAKNGANAELKELAEMIVAEQAREIGEMQALLEDGVGSGGK